VGSISVRRNDNREYLSGSGLITRLPVIDSARPDTYLDIAIETAI
jgi:hypothetical protein